MKTPKGKCAVAAIFGDKWCPGGEEEDPLCQKCPLLKKNKHKRERLKREWAKKIRDKKI